MTEDELVDALARRLSEISIAEGERIVATFGDNPDRVPARAFLGLNRALALECLRQKEWSRRYDSGQGSEWDGSLTLAPPEWKPSDETRP